MFRPVASTVAILTAALSAFTQPAGANGPKVEVIAQGHDSARWAGMSTS
jgi:hypothetical protein